VVIPCYNGARFLGEAIESVLSQRYPATDIIVVEDGSVDSSLSFLSRHPSLRTLRQRHAGVAVARNTGLQHRTGDYIAFLDQDDRLLPDALRSNVRMLAGAPPLRVQL
jgi:glycosyltransferase involved in cell wall biosynthesis